MNGVAMSRFIFADHRHDAEIRAILRETAMGTRILLSFEREPSFFDAERIGNDWSQVMALISNNGRVQGFGSRAGRSTFINGSIAQVGYLSQLRSHSSIRGGIYLAKAYRFLREIETTDRRVPFSLTTILDENLTARAILESGRAGLPNYRPWAALRTFSIATNARERRPASVECFDLSAGRQELFRDANSWSQRFLFGPSYDHAAFAWMDTVPTSCYRVSGADCAGSMIACDLSAMKQVVIRGYGGILAPLRPFLNGIASFTWRPRLPAIGEHVRIAYLFAMALRGNERRAFRDLIAAARRDWAERADILVVAFDARHPLANECARYACATTASTLYVVDWNAPDFDPPIPKGIVHVDAGSL